MSASRATSLLLAAVLIAAAQGSAAVRGWRSSEPAASWTSGWARGLLQSSEEGSCDAEVARALERQKEALEDRIVGGVEVRDPDRYPYIANLVRYGRSEFCGGSLIAPNVILTAAHCEKSRTTVWLGRYDLGEREEYEEFGIVEKAYPNPRWDSDTNDNDLMLLLLDGSSKFKPVAIDGGDDEPFVEAVEDESRRVFVTTMGWVSTALLHTRGLLSSVVMHAYTSRACTCACVTAPAKPLRRDERRPRRRRLSVAQPLLSIVDCGPDRRDLTRLSMVVGNM